MGKVSVFNWPAADVTAICKLQTTTGAGYLALNGDLSLPIYGGQYIPLVNIQRTITLTSTNDLAGVDVTITGTLEGKAVSVTHAGPNDATYTTTQLFDSITSIYVSGAVTAMSVGTGATGQTKWWTYDPFVPYAAAIVQCIATATINYTLQVTLDDVLTTTPNVFTPVTALTGATTSELAEIAPLPIKYANIIINSSSGSGALVSTFLQQGVKA